MKRTNNSAKKPHAKKAKKQNNNNNNNVAINMTNRKLYRLPGTGIQLMLTHALAQEMGLIEIENLNSNNNNNKKKK